MLIVIPNYVAVQLAQHNHPIAATFPAKVARPSVRELQLAVRQPAPVGALRQPSDCMSPTLRCFCTCQHGADAADSSKCFPGRAPAYPGAFALPAGSTARVQDDPAVFLRC